MSVTITTNFAEVNSALDRLGEKVEATVRPAAQAAAQVLYEEVMRSVQAIPKKTGNLAKSIYQVYSREKSSETNATYHISWNARKAPHGHLIEFGHWMRYVAIMNTKGEWYTLRRPESAGKPRPSRRASTAAKDAFYVTLPAPRWIPPKPFVRPAASKFPIAIEHALAVIRKAMQV